MMVQKSSVIGAMLFTFMLLLFVDFRRADGVFHTFLAPVFLRHSRHFLLSCVFGLVHSELLWAPVLQFPGVFPSAGV